MPSSIFSSDPSQPISGSAPSGRDQPIQVAVKTLISGVLVFGLVVLMYVSLGIGEYNDRIEKPLGMLKTISENLKVEPQIIVYGSSMVQYGFDPLLFDAELALRGVTATSYNFGVPNVDPGYQEIMTRRIREHFEAERAKIDLVLLEFNPFQLTKVREARSFTTRDQNHAILFSGSELWDVVRKDPARGIRLLNIRYLRDGISAEMLTSFAPSILFRQNGSHTPAYKAALLASAKALSEFERLRDRDAGGGFVYWNEEFRGGRNDKKQFQEDTLSALRDWNEKQRHPLILQADLDRRVRTADIFNLEFSENLSRSFIKMVKNLEAVSDNIDIILMPRNTAWIDYDADAQHRLEAMLERIHIETGIVVRNFQLTPGIGPEHFRDTTHLSTYDGADIFTTTLAEYYAPLILDSKRSTQDPN
ncbi:MAG: hypothetical protein ACFHXK_09200 [bacterium]